MLFISQPALSRQIQELEEELGCKLLVRSKKQVSLTEQGYLFQLRAQEILNIYDETKSSLSERGDFLAGTIHVGCVESNIINFVTDLFIRFRNAYPHVKMEMYSADSDDLKNKLDENKLDMAFLLEPVEAAKYNRIPLPATDRWGVVVKNDKSFRNKSSLSSKETAKLPLLLPRRYIVLDEICSWLGVPEKELNVVIHHNLATNALVLVQKGLGNLLCIEGSFTCRKTQGLKFLPIVPERLSKHVLVRKKNRTLSKAAELFWTEACTESKKLTERSKD